MFEGKAPALISAALCIAMAGVLLSHISRAGFYEMKIEGVEDEKNCYSNCYTSNPRGYFPVTIRVPTRRIFPDSLLKLSDMTTLYCLPYACQQRKDGFFKERPREVYLLGNSFAFGEGNKEEDTLGYYLGLKFTGTNFRNFGSTGADIKAIDTITQGLFHDPSHSSPRKIILFYNISEFAALSDENLRTQRAVVNVSNVPLSGPRHMDDMFNDFLWKFAWGRFIKDLFVLHGENNYLTVDSYRDIYFNPVNAQDLQRSLAHLLAMDRLARNEGASLMVVIYPQMVKDIWGRYPFALCDRVLKEFCLQHQLAFIDGYEPFKDYYSMDKFIVHPAHAHPNGLANRILTDYLSQNSLFKEFILK